MDTTEEIAVNEPIERRKYGAPHDPRVTGMLTVASTVLAALVAAGAIGIFNVSKDVAVLLARPAGVPSSEYTRDQARTAEDFNQFKAQIKDLQIAVEKLRTDEIQDNINYHNRQRQQQQ